MCKRSRTGWGVGEMFGVFMDLKVACIVVELCFSHSDTHTETLSGPSNNLCDLPPSLTQSQQLLGFK